MSATLRRRQTMCVTRNLPRILPGSAHRTAAHRPPALLQPSRIVRDHSSARKFRDGPDGIPSGLVTSRDPTLYAWSRRCVAVRLTLATPLLLLVGADGFEPPCLARPDLQSGAFDRSATHPKERDKKHKARSPFGASGPCGLRSFDLSVGVIRLHPGCFLLRSHSNRCAHIPNAH